LEREWKIEHRFGDRLIKEGDNLTVLESTLNNPIKVMAAVEVSYEIHCRRGQILCFPGSTIIVFLNDLRRNKLIAVEARNPDNTDEVLDMQLVLSTLAGKGIPVFCEGDTAKFKLILDDGSHLKPDIKLPTTLGDVKLALLSRYRN
jgi:hypothetical protein